MRVEKGDKEMTNKNKRNFFQHTRQHDSDLAVSNARSRFRNGVPRSLLCPLQRLDSNRVLEPTS